MRILVTGGAGFIGSHVVEQFQGRAEIRVLDNLRSGFRKNLTGLDHEFIEGSITDEAVVREAVSGVDYVFHLAALVSVPESMERISECVDLNVHGLLNVLKASAKAKVRKLVFASSAAIYGNNPIVPKVETMIPEPRSPYAITKLDGEFYCDFFAREAWVPTACLRFFNVFGPRQDPASAYAAAIPIFIQKALKNEPLTVYGDGSQTRDFIYVKDIVSALEFCALNENAAGVFNCGYGGTINLNDLIQRIVGLAQSSSVIINAPPRAGDVRHSQADARKLRDAGWVPQSSLTEGLVASLNFFQQSR